MATKQTTIDIITEQLIALPSIATRKMFGEYALYCSGKVVALICDNKLFVKITPAGKDFVGSHYEEGYAYQGAKASMYINDDLIDDSQWLCQLIEITAASLPLKKGTI